MWGASYWPTSYWPASYWPKTGATPVVPIVVPALEGVDWSTMYRPALALAPSAVASVNPDPTFGLTPTTGTPPGEYDWTRRGGEAE